MLQLLAHLMMARHLISPMWLEDMYDDGDDDDVTITYVQKQGELPDLACLWALYRPVQNCLCDAGSSLAKKPWCACA